MVLPHNALVDAEELVSAVHLKVQRLERRDFKAGAQDSVQYEADATIADHSRPHQTQRTVVEHSGCCSWRLLVAKDLAQLGIADKHELLDARSFQSSQCIVQHVRCRLLHLHQQRHILEQIVKSSSAKTERGCESIRMLTPELHHHCIEQHLSARLDRFDHFAHVRVATRLHDEQRFVRALLGEQLGVFIRSADNSKLARVDCDRSSGHERIERHSRDADPLEKDALRVSLDL